MLSALSLFIVLNQPSVPRLDHVEWQSARQVRLDERTGVLGPNGKLWRYRLPGYRMFSVDFGGLEHVQSVKVKTDTGFVDGFLEGNNVFWTEAPWAGTSKEVEFTVGDDSSARVNQPVTFNVNTDRGGIYSEKVVDGADLRAYNFRNAGDSVRFDVDYRLAVSLQDLNLFVRGGNANANGVDLGLHEVFPSDLAGDELLGRRGQVFEFKKPSGAHVAITVGVSGYAWSLRNPEKIATITAMIPDPGIEHTLGPKLIAAEPDVLAGAGIERFRDFRTDAGKGAILGKLWLPVDATNNFWKVDRIAATSEAGPLAAQADPNSSPLSGAYNQFHFNSKPGGPGEFGVDLLVPYENNKPRQVKIQATVQPYHVERTVVNFRNIPVPEFGHGNNLDATWSPDGKDNFTIESVLWVTPDTAASVREEVGTTEPYALAFKVRLHPVLRDYRDVTTRIMLTEARADNVTRYQDNVSSTVETNRPGSVWLVATPPPPGTKVIQIRLLRFDAAKSGPSIDLALPTQKIG